MKFLFLIFCVRSFFLAVRVEINLLVSSHFLYALFAIHDSLSAVQADPCLS